MTGDPIAKTLGGELRGKTEGDLEVFRGVPYAAPPVGELRWQSTQGHPGWDGVRDASNHGPVCPQPMDLPWNPLMGVKGRDRSNQGEDCLTLTIHSPVEAKDLPVFVYIHGGGNVIGAGSWDVFSGEQVARNGKLVTVGVNYRFGPFGYLVTEESGAARGNWWLDDQMAALRWVQENIAAFGGDPTQVTVAGHSGGAASIATICGLPAARGLFRRAILMGLPLGFAARPKDEALRASARYLELLGVDDLAQARSLPAEALVSSEARLTAEMSGWNLWCPGFCNVIDDQVLHHQALEAIETGEGPDAEMLIGWTREEYAMSCLTDESMIATTREQAVERARLAFGDAAEEAYEEYAKARPGALPVQVLIDILSDERYRMGAMDLADLRHRQGRSPFVYQLDWQTPAVDGLLGAPHCLDIPFALNVLDAWSDGEMFAGTDTPARQALADAMHASVIGFVRAGDPNHGGIPEWKPYSEDRAAMMRFDSVTQPVEDLVGHWRRTWKRLGGTQR